MSRKRPASESLTGGTRDVNPQTLGGTATTSAANTFGQSTIPLPINRSNLGAPGGQSAQVIEALWVEFDFGEVIFFNNGGEEAEAQVTTSSKSQIEGIDDVDIIAKDGIRLSLLTSGASISKNTSHFDLTDGAGHGLLIATNNIFFGVDTAGLAGTSTMRFRMAYRFKNVSIQEYVGLAIQFGQT